MAVAMAAGRGSPALVELGEDLLGGDVNPLELVAANVVQVDTIKAEVDELLNPATGGVRIGGDERAPLEALGPNELGHLREVVRRSDISLREFHPAVWPLGHRVAHRFLVGARPGEVELEDPGHRRRIFARLARALLEALEDALDLFLRRPDGDQAVAEPPGLFSGHRPGGSDVNGRRLLPQGA